MATLVTKQTDLTPFIGVRVKVTRTVKGVRYTYHGVFESLKHWNSRSLGCMPGTDLCGGMMHVEPSPGMWSGNTGFDLPYDNAEIELAPLPALVKV